MLPCDIWRAVRDPALSEEEFERSVEIRIRNLSGGVKNGI